jgi:hypothetical protein
MHPTPPALHTASLYDLLTCAKLSVSVKSSLFRISPVNTSGSFVAIAATMDNSPRRRNVTASDSYDSLFLFSATMAVSKSEGARPLESFIFIYHLGEVKKNWPTLKNQSHTR